MSYTFIPSECFKLHKHVKLLSPVQEAKWPKRDADRSSAPNADVYMSGATPLPLLYAVVACTRATLLSVGHDRPIN